VLPGKVPKVHESWKKFFLKLPCGQGHVTLTFLGYKC